MRPPFSFVLLKENAPRPVEKKGVQGLKLDPFQGQVWAKTRRPQQETAQEAFGRIAGRGPGCAEICSFVPATGNCEVGVQNRFDLLLPSAAALPTSNQPALSEARSAEIVAGQMR